MCNTIQNKSSNNNNNINSRTKQSTANFSPREEETKEEEQQQKQKVDNNHNNNDEIQEPLLVDGVPPLPSDDIHHHDNNNDEDDEDDDIDALLDSDLLQKQSTISSSSPVEIGNALLVFIMTEEIPVIIISLALQVAFNYTALLQYGTAFGVSDANYDSSSAVYAKDAHSRDFNCVLGNFESELSSMLSFLSSFVPFM